MSSAEKTGPTDDTRVTRMLAGRYRLMRLIGHGGMGSVYEAVHIHTEKRVAIKLLSPSLSKDLKLVARFRREAMAASRLEHENCVHVDDFGEDADGTFYITMELVDGHGLADELRKAGPMPWERVAQIGVQLLKALDAAHAAGVLHRDLKPQNVMITQKQGRPDIVKVVDFGIAKITTNSAEDQGALTVPGTIFGTPEYMSPEQARGEVLDVRSDVYSASVVLWHMLLGRSPFRGTSVRETLMKVFAEDAPSAATERPASRIPRGFEDILKRGMAKAKEQRYPDAASYLEALRPYISADIDLPRRPEPGLARDGGPPPSTIDDSPHSSATMVLPEAELAPMAAPAPRAAPPGAEGAAATVALSVDQLPPLAASRGARSGSGGQTDETITAARAARRPGLSGAAIAVLVVAAVGACALLFGAYLLLQRARHPRHAADGPVATLTERDKDTTRDRQAREDAVRREPRPVSPDPVARDEAIARAKKAMEEGNSHVAAGAYDEALVADPYSANAHVGRATVAMAMKDWVTARDHLASAMELDPAHASMFKDMHARARKLAEGSPPP